jgi:hypothetical protein
MNNSTIEQDIKEAEKLSAESWYMENDKTKLDKPIGLGNWILVIIFSFLSGLLASSIGFYYMFFIKYN